MDHPVYRGSYMPETASRPYRNSLTARRVMRSIGVPLLGRPLAFPRSCILLCTILTGGLFLSLVLEIFAITEPKGKGLHSRRIAGSTTRSVSFLLRDGKRGNDIWRSWTKYFWKLERNKQEARREVTLDRNSSNFQTDIFKSLHLRLTFSLPIIENTRWIVSTWLSRETMKDNRRSRFFPYDYDW